MREPAIQTRLLASAPLFFGAWGFAAWSVYQWSQHADAWPVALISCGVVAGVMKADEQVRAYKAWKREWDAMSDTAPPARRKTPSAPGVILAALVGLPLLSMLMSIHQHNGTQAVIGVLMILFVPLAIIAGIVKLARRVRHRPRAKGSRVQPVTTCIRRPLMPVPDIRTAYHDLPDYCRAIMRPLS